MQTYQHMISVRLNDLLLEQLETQTHNMRSNYSEVVRLALTLLFSRKLRDATCMTSMTTNIGVL